MAEGPVTIDLGALGLSSGEGRRLELEVPIDPLRFGGQEYRANAAEGPVVLDIARTISGGYALRIRYSVRLSGPCARCLEDAGAEVPIDAREVDQPGQGGELESPYVRGERLHLGSWARDALALSLPDRILCADDCLGLCVTCGENLNEAAPGHGHAPSPDPRWAKLGELRLEQG